MVNIVRSVTYMADVHEKVVTILGFSTGFI